MKLTRERGFLTVLARLRTHPYLSTRYCFIFRCGLDGGLRLRPRAQVPPGVEEHLHIRIARGQGHLDPPDAHPNLRPDF